MNSAGEVGPATLLTVSDIAGSSNPDLEMTFDPTPFLLSPLKQITLSFPLILFPRPKPWWSSEGQSN